jgi:hypothetical protein
MKLDSVIFTDVVLGSGNTEKTYTVKIVNFRGGLSIFFNDDEFLIHCDGEEVSFSRLLRRPGHDHDDIQTLFIRKDQPKPVFLRDSNYSKDPVIPFRIPFGKIVS